MNWNLIWQVDPEDPASCVEQAWFREMITGVPILSENVDYRSGPRLERMAPHSIVCVSCPNQTSKDDLIDYLQRLPRPVVLYHMSDEFLAVGDEVYRHCDLAIRNGSRLPTPADPDRLLQLPLGFVSGLRHDGSALAAASTRKISFSFLGAIKNERASEMLPALETLPKPHYVRKTASFAAAAGRFDATTAAIYKNSVFVPNPKGNWNPECHRLYDALEWGCIPLIRNYPGSEYLAGYHDRLLGPHPIPSFDSWAEAAAFARDCLADPHRLDALQDEVGAWWQSFKRELAGKVSAALARLDRSGLA